ncbi:12572_t:CDS:2 [Funneliformis geosporum]|nr:12572_t:CDS:2 [Funneliformis geosporum]
MPTSKRKHPHQKPRELIKALISATTNEDSNLERYYFYHQQERGRKEQQEFLEREQTKKETCERREREFSVEQAREEQVSIKKIEERHRKEVREVERGQELERELLEKMEHFLLGFDKALLEDRKGKFIEELKDIDNSREFTNLFASIQTPLLNEKNGQIYLVHNSAQIKKDEIGSLIHSQQSFNQTEIEEIDGVLKKISVGHLTGEEEKEKKFREKLRQPFYHTYLTSHNPETPSYNFCNVLGCEKMINLGCNYCSSHTDECQKERCLARISRNQNYCLSHKKQTLNDWWKEGKITDEEINKLNEFELSGEYNLKQVKEVLKEDKCVNDSPIISDTITGYTDFQKIIQDKLLSSLKRVRPKLTLIVARGGGGQPPESEIIPFST